MARLHNMEHSSIAKLDQATRMLAEVRSIDDAKDLINLAEAARVYAKQVELGLEAQNHAAEIKLHAQRKAGEILSSMEKAKGGQPYQATGNSLKPVETVPQTYAELGIDKRDAHTWQTFATNTSPEEFQEIIDEKKDKGQELSTAELYRELKKKKQQQNIQKQIEQIESEAITKPTGLFDVIVVDPPWPYGTEYDPNGRRAANPYPEMSLEHIKSIELPAKEDCVLWLWTTHKFMRYSFEILDTWGFRDVAILTWAKDRMGLGTWLRSQSEFCIMAVRGKPIVTLTNQTTVINGPLREHSRKPDEFYAMVDSLCHGRKLDYFSREKRDGWDQLGNTTELYE